MVDELMSGTNEQQLQAVLHSEIPLTRHMGIEVLQYTGLGLSLAAPLENNINHKCTAFGGSLYSLAVLSGWGLVYLKLKEQGMSGHIVIQESHTRFIKPVDQGLESRCSFESEQQVQRFLTMYRRKGLARVELQTRIRSGAADGVVFSGRYVVHQ